MSAQTTYRGYTTIGLPGYLVDNAPYTIDAYTNEATTGTMKFGVAVVKGEGNTFNYPTSESTAADLLGITFNGRTTEYDLIGKIYIRENATIGIMNYGRIYGRVAAEVEPKFGDAVYVITSGDEVGYLTTVADGNIALNARFLGKVDETTGIAPVEIFNSAK